MKHGVRYDLSEQQVIDCSGSAGNNYCVGGSMSTVFKWAETNKLMKESDYPYIKKYSGSCNQVSSKGVINTTGYVGVSGNVNALMTAVA